MGEGGSPNGHESFAAADTEWHGVGTGKLGTGLSGRELLQLAAALGGDSTVTVDYLFGPGLPDS